MIAGFGSKPFHFTCSLTDGTKLIVFMFFLVLCMVHFSSLLDIPITHAHSIIFVCFDIPVFTLRGELSLFGYSYPAHFNVLAMNMVAMMIYTCYSSMV